MNKNIIFYQSFVIESLRLHTTALHLLLLATYTVEHVRMVITFYWSTHCGRIEKQPQYTKHMHILPLMFVLRYDDRIIVPNINKESMRREYPYRSLSIVAGVWPYFGRCSPNIQLLPLFELRTYDRMPHEQKQIRLLVEYFGL